MNWLTRFREPAPLRNASDLDIELLLRRTPTITSEYEDLEVFLGALARRVRPPEDTEFMGIALAARARAARRPSPVPKLRRLAVVAVSFAVLLAFSGVAMAADGAAPGDFLYRLDRALEQIGIGDGGVDERIAEFDALMSDGEEERAFALLDEFATSTGDPEAAKAQRHLELAAAKSNDNAVAAQDRVATKKQYIEENQGRDVGDDKRKFGDGVGGLAQPGSETGNEVKAPEKKPSTDTDTDSADSPKGSGNPGKSESSSTSGAADKTGSTGKQDK